MKSTFPPVEEQLARLKGSVAPVEIINEEELTARLERSRAEGRPLRVKQGFDASAPDLHIGHAVSLWKLRAFQELGHTVIFLIGDFTGMVGDPSGRSKTRPRLTREEVEANAQTYRDQVSRVLDPDKIEIRYNSEWHGERDIYEFLDLVSRRTVARILERADFRKRLQADDDISILEFLYPLIQAYDSVALEADVELGGTDQKFNLVMTRQIQRAYGLEPQVLLLMPLLRGTDGNKKMSKSLGNVIDITDPPEEMYGRVMSISDDLIEEYYRLTSGLSSAEVEAKLTGGDPYKLKHELARMIVARYHDEKAAGEAGEEFLARFRQHEWPTVEELIAKGNVAKIKSEHVWLPAIIHEIGATRSKGEAKRLIAEGAVSIDKKRISIEDLYTSKSEDVDPHLSGVNQARREIREGKLKFPRTVQNQTPFVLKVGKRRFYLIYHDEEQLKRHS